MNTTRAWTDLWFYWLLFVAISWAIFEGASLILAHRAQQRIIETWTLSDTIRRWSASRRWLAPVVIGVTAMLAWHFFGQTNPL